ncbi:MAG: sigma-70 family RNA polymerase sigma factor [Candidatus Aminicenantes bacterium]|nr:sigma-70 family RNA polymerase sigma factor [Candidatus Aminicenantes bacterium]
MSQRIQDCDALIAQYRPVVSFRVRRALGGDIPDWEDVVNEILTQVLEKVRNGEFRGESSLGTFIYTVTSRRIVDFIRRKTKILKSGPEPSVPPDPQESLEASERADQLVRHIRMLKPKYRDVLFLFYFQELTREEVALKLGITPAKVSERLHYAQKLLRKKIRK